MGAPASLTWLAGDLDSATLNALPESARTIVTAPGDLPVTEEMTYTSARAQC